MSRKGREIYSQLTTTFTVLVSGEAMSFPAPHSYSPAASRVIAVMFIFSPVQVCLAVKGREKETHVQVLLESRGRRYGPKITSRNFRVFFVIIYKKQTIFQEYSTATIIYIYITLAAFS